MCMYVCTHLYACVRMCLSLCACVHGVSLGRYECGMLSYKLETNL